MKYLEIKILANIKYNGILANIKYNGVT